MKINIKNCLDGKIFFRTFVKTFEDWYNQQGFIIPLYNRRGDNFNQYEQEIGFIKDQGQIYWQAGGNSHYLTYPKVACEEFENFEKLLLFYFNN